MAALVPILCASLQRAILYDGAASPIAHRVAADAPDGPDCTFAASRPREYSALKLDTLLSLDGDLSKPEWAAVPWTDDFVDISTSTTPRLRTRAKMRWDDEFLYVGAELEDPQLWATLTEHNSVIFNDNDFEIFVDPNATTWGYKEFEMNALNSTWDLMLNRPYGDGGGEHSCRVDTPPCFDMQPPLASAVRLNGSLNDPAAASDGGWSVEVALPIKALMAHNADAAQTPKAGVFWRINFSRVQVIASDFFRLLRLLQVASDCFRLLLIASDRINFSRVQWALQVNGSSYVKQPSCQSCAHPGDAAEDNWVWSPQGVVAMHNPETWAIVQFADGATPEATYAEWPARALARALYNAEHAFSAASSGGGASFTDDLAALDELSEPKGVLGACARAVHIELGPNGSSFDARLGSLAGSPSVVAQVTDLRFTTVTSRS